MKNICLKVKKCSRWKKEEIDFLKQNYKHMTASKIANKLNRTHGSVARKKYELKLTKQKSWSKEETIKELKYLAKKLNCSPSARDLPILYQACLKYFGSFNKAKELAGLGVKKYKNIVKNKKLTKELAYILGTVSGDGWINLRKEKGRSGGIIGLKVKDKDFSLEFKTMLEKWSGCDVKFSEMLDGFYYVRLYSVSAVEIIKNFNLKKILFASQKKQSLFTKGMFDSEGGIIGKNLDKRVKAKRWIHFSNSDEYLIDIVSSLLSNFNIKHSIKSRIHSGFKSKKIQYEILIYGLENLTKFKDNIGFSIKRKQEKLIKVINSYGG